MEYVAVSVVTGSLTFVSGARFFVRMLWFDVIKYVGSVLICYSLLLLLHMRAASSRAISTRTDEAPPD